MKWVLRLMCERACPDCPALVRLDRLEVSLSGLSEAARQTLERQDEVVQIMEDTSPANANDYEATDAIRDDQLSATEQLAFGVLDSVQASANYRSEILRRCKRGSPLVVILGGAIVTACASRTKMPSRTRLSVVWSKPS